MKRIIVGILCIILLTGCGKTTQDTQKNHAENTKNTETVITMMYSGTVGENDFETEQLPKLIKKYFPNVRLKVTKLPDDQYYTSLKTMLSSGECPDMIFVQAMYAGENSVYSLAKAGYLEPLNDLKCIHYSGTCSDYFTLDDNVYAVSSGISLLGTYYNKDIFSKLKLKEPKNWEEFLACCEKIKQSGITPIVAGDKDQYTLQFCLYQIAANQIYPKNKKYDDMLWQGTSSFTDAGTWDTVLEMQKVLYDKGYIDEESFAYSEQQALEKFKKGAAAMMVGGSFHLTAISQNNEKFNFGLFPLPGNHKGEKLYISATAGGGPAIYSGSKHKELCKKILERMHDGQSDIWKKMVERETYIPVYGWGSEQINPLYQPFLKKYNNGDSFYWCNQGWPSGTENELERLFYRMIGTKSSDINAVTKGVQNKFMELKK